MLLLDSPLISDTLVVQTQSFFSLIPQKVPDLITEAIAEISLSYFDFIGYLPKSCHAFMSK
jgi:hypothetical protein